MEEQTKRTKVLVVDDEKGICSLLSRELTKSGYDVHVASAAEQALQMAEKEQYIVAITDLKMPGMGGMAFLKEIKKKNPGIEVIIITGFGTMETTMEAFQAGAIDYVLKPFNIEDLKLKVKKALDHYHSQQTITLLNENLTNTYVELEKLKDSLEAKVEERTRELTESEKRFRMIIDGSFDPIVTVTGDFGITGWNKGAEFTFGYASGEALSMNLKDFFVLHPEKVVASLTDKMKAEGGFVRNYVTKCFTKGKGEIDVNITASSLEGHGFSMIIRDITRERRIDQMKTDFVSNVSHELRTPLTSIKGSVELILGGTEGPLTDSQKELLGIMRNNTVRLIKLISELLDIAKIESGRIEMDLKAASIITVIKSTIDETKAIAQKKNVNLVLTEPGRSFPDLYIDENRIKQVLVNLIGNALKFTPEKGSVTVSIRETESELQIGVSDTGMGISKENFDMIFEKFRQVDSSSTRAAGGTGLGLSIAKSIIEAHKGRIWVESEPGRGSTFSFSIPKPEKQIAEAMKKEAPEVVAVNKEYRIKRILVVDDDEDLTVVIKGHLEKQGYEIHVANSGMDAIKKAVELKPDLITLDLLMPQVDGYFVTKLLKQNPATKDIPIVIVSAILEKEKCFRLGISDYLTKPFDSQDLIEAVKRTERQIRGEKMKRKVLVVDDDPDIIAVLTLSLTNRDYSVYNAYDGIQAIALAKKEKPDMIILDLMLPSVDGFEVIRNLKKDKETSEIPIIVITGRTIEDKEKAIQLGAKEYLLKPFTMRMLYEELDRILQKEVK
ncbi:MAG: response regulator [Endomicrobiales bacterium]|nr:response regulator [Endomicrobiales bacterium]